jgi:hypothetical protein
MIDICYSGGAKGADTVFGECAAKAGHIVTHYSFRDHLSATSSVYRLTDEELRTADFELKLANKVLNRHFPTSNEYVNNLLRRNYFQIRSAGRIYAVTSLDNQGIPHGGTAWAIVMGINQGIKDIYVFDTIKNHWFAFDGFDAYKNRYDWIYAPHNVVPRPSGEYAGIGSRDLSKEGEKAIRELYE